MKKWQKILVGVIVVFLALGIFKDILIKGLVESGASFVTGAPVKIRSLAVGVFRPRVVIEDVKMYNPEGFPSAVMVDVPLIRVVYDLPALFKGELHLPEVTFDLKEVVLYKNREGQLNVDALKVSQQKSEPREEDTQKKSKTAKIMPMRMDVVNLNLGRVVVKDYSAQGPVEVLAYPLGVENRTFKNITSPQQLVTVVLVRAMAPTALKNAALYAAATALGVAFLPAGVAGVLLGKDSAVQTFPLDVETAYEKTKVFLSENGQIVETDPGQGFIKAKLGSSDLTLMFSRKEEREVEITVKARKMMLPKAEVAEGLLYQLAELFGRGTK